MTNVSLKKMLANISETLVNILSYLTVETISVSPSSTTRGTFVSYNCKRYGKVVWFQATVRNTSSTAAGANIYEGTMSTSLPRPYAFTTGGSYYGVHAITGSINANRTLIIRNASSTAVTIDSNNTASVSFTYITQD